MKKNAFTLIELLGVLLLLAVIALITFPIIDNTLTNSRNEAYERQKDNIIEAARMYVTENGKYDTEQKSLDFQTLINAGYLKDGDILDPRDSSKKMPGCILYNWSDSKNQYIYEYSEECKVPVSLIKTLLKQYDSSNTTGLVKDKNNSNLYYYTGTNEEVANNFLWYGGHQWRVIEFDTSANTLTLITQQPLTIIQAASTVWKTKESYESSYVNQWLNDYFLSSLDSSIQNNILDNTFNIGMYTDVDSVTTIQKVGLLDIRQIERAGNFDSFLINKNSEYMVGNLCDNSNLCQMSIEGKKFFVGSPNNFQGVRAVIKISDFTIIEGDGTLTSSYRTTNKTSDTNEVQVGEYINVPYSGDDNACGVDNMCTFRVVSKDNDSIKVVLNGLLPNTSKYGSTVTITISHTIYTSLNKFIEGISDMYRYTKNKTFYIGDYPKSSSYKDVQDEFLESSVGLPTVGEMFSSNDIALGTTSDKTFVDVNTIENLTVSIYYWTMNRFSSTGILAVYSGKLVSQKDTSFGVRPVIYLKSGLTFTGGEGTAQSPYTLK